MIFDRHSGKLLWQRAANYSFRHNAIVVGAGKVFCIDGIPPASLAIFTGHSAQRDAARQPDYRPRLLALDARTGHEVWNAREDVFGTFLGYSAKRDVLLQAGSSNRDRALDETKTGMVACQSADGKVLWKDLHREYQGPCMLYHDTIITEGKAYLLLTGEPKCRQDPLTGRRIPWVFERNYGCNTSIASEHLLTFRSAAAGFYDLARDGGTGNFGGFKSGCTSNLIVADGVLNAHCATGPAPQQRHQNYTFLRMVHPDQAAPRPASRGQRRWRPWPMPGFKFAGPARIRDGR